MSGKRVYIAGPMRGIPQFNFPAFDAARDKLVAAGWEVISPVDLDRQVGFDESAFPDDPDYDWRDLDRVGFSLERAVSRDVEALKQCDAIVLLCGWEGSKGAQAEKALAEWLGLTVLYQHAGRGEDLILWGEPKPIRTGGDPRDGETIVNESGGMQSFISARFDCIPPECLRLLAQCLGFGARKYGKDNWRQIGQEDNLAHAMNHLNEYRLGDRSEPHLVNAMARVTFALSQAVESGDQAARYEHPDEVH